MGKKMTAEMVHKNYSGAAKSCCKMAPPVVQPRLYRELDDFMRQTAAGVWSYGGELSNTQLDAYNAIYMDGCPAPRALYWELNSLVTNYGGFRVPDLFLALVKLDEEGRAAQRFVDFFSTMILLFAAADDTITNAEADFITDCCIALCEAGIRHGLSGLAPTSDSREFVTEEGGGTAAKTEAEAEGETAAQPEAEAEPLPTLEELLAELDDLCGLDQIKRDVRSLINLVKIRRLREENESLRTTLSAPGNAQEPVPDAWETEAELSDEEFCPEEEGALLALLNQPEPELEQEEEEPPETDTPEPEPEEPAPESSEEEDDFMHAFMSYAENMMNMTPIERMTANGREVMVISLDELIAEARAQQERRRVGY